LTCTRHALIGVLMLYNFHIGNRKSRAVISDAGMPSGAGGAYTPRMADRIGSKHPSRLFIREWIKKRGLDQKRVAERMDCEPGTLSKLLNGKMEMTTAWLAGIADALDVSVPDLFRDPDMPTRDELLSLGPVTTEEFKQALQLVRIAKTGTDSR
jgi:transcriptional regulator with XRE-family HTH domain